MYPIDKRINYQIFTGSVLIHEGCARIYRTPHVHVHAFLSSIEKFIGI